MKRRRFFHVFTVSAALVSALIHWPDVFAQATAPAAATARGGAGRGGIPSATTNQVGALAAMEQALTNLTARATEARTALVAASFLDPRNNAALSSRLTTLAIAESALAAARADQFATIQASADKLNAEQVSALVAQGGRAGGRGGGNVSEPLNFRDRTGFVSIFDGTLNGWDGNPEVWRIVDGAISADSTVTPGQTFITYKGPGSLLKNFELKLEAKFTGTGVDSGIQYRSVQGPGAGARGGNQWTVSGYQYDLNWANTFTGQVVDAGRGIVAHPGELVQLVPEGRHIIIGTPGDTPVQQFVKQGDWNEIHLIANGNTLIHIMNGHLMSFALDYDTARFRPEGIIAFQVAGTGQVYFKNIWVKKLAD